MATLKAVDYPSGRIDAGNAVLQAASAVDSTPIHKRLTGFQKSHTAYVAAEDRVRRAAAAVQKQQAIVGEFDVTQDESLNRLASSLAGDGFSRINPFKELKFDSPSTIAAMNSVEEAVVVTKLGAAVLKSKKASKGSLDLAKKAQAAAAAVHKGAAPIPELQKAQQAAITYRDTLGIPWEKNFAALKRAARAAEDDGHVGLFEALFQRTVRAAAPKKPKAAKTPAPAPAPASASAPKPTP